MLIENWKQAYKFWSVQCALAVAFVNVYAVINALLAGLVAVVRVMAQLPIGQSKEQ
ncbi:hypothetical protein ACN1T8_003828 [Vibrio cholerae]|uniref:DUF7940 domain-containing protein n=1 Tax=Vibrio cholerae TaxID=666 RepID=UPI001C92C2ED|nr:hypothetical protein [Vibrio cholerae]MBY4642222.1 hypothetical protein [Vibrio cholerae]MCR9658494.1 hypothetical protein [Vibrio cholerae]MCR9689175.1 hypothetical protein [Vibrio cholerae]MCR9746507.1 hypothetical protein [Vibrio cholerae]